METNDRIAIVGMGGVFSLSPTLEQFWEHIVRARDTSREVSPGRWLLAPEDAFDPRIVETDKLYCTRGYFIDDIPRENTEHENWDELDPVCHLVLYAGARAWRDAKTAGINPERAGVIFGNIVLPTERSSAITQEILGNTAAEQIVSSSQASQLSEVLENFGRFDTSSFDRYAAGAPARLLAGTLNLGAGGFTLDAACASSLYALKLAADWLQSGRADVMLAGGVSRPDCLYTQMGFSQLRALSPSGRCRPFDSRGDGLVVGEGAGFFVLKRLEDALQQGDKIYATIAGIGLSNDVGGNLLAPNSEGQLRAMHAAYAQAGWRPKDVDLIECHGTGTPVGDTVELKSLRQLWQESSWRRGQCVIGSVKSNIGHTLTAAGAAALLKVLLALRHEMLPPTANFSHARDAELGNSPFRILDEAIPWNRRHDGQPRRAAISAFGFGGTNAHVLLEEWQPAAASSSPLSLPSSNLGTRHSTFPPVQKKQAIAVIGMAARFGSEQVPGATEETRPTSDVSGRWWGVENSRWFRELGLTTQRFSGHFINELIIALDEFRIAPRDLEEMLPQQLLMLQVAAKALKDANLSDIDRKRTGVFIGLELDFNTTNFHFRWSLLNLARQWDRDLSLNLSANDLEKWTADLRAAAGPPLTAGRVLGALGSITASRIARVFGIGGPSFTVSSEETSGLSALDVAMQMLRRGEIDYAIVGAVDFPGDVRAALLSAASGKTSEPISDGAVAFILRREEEVRRDGDRIYALLNEITNTPLQHFKKDSPLTNCGAASGLVSQFRDLVVDNARTHDSAQAAHPKSSPKKAVKIRVGHPPMPLPGPPGYETKPIQEERKTQHAESFKGANAGSPHSALVVLTATQTAKAKAHQSFLGVMDRAQTIIGEIAKDFRSVEATGETPVPRLGDTGETPVPRLKGLDRQQCLEFAVGSISNVLGPDFAEVDFFPTRVRLPAEPLMLVDRIVSIEGEPKSMTSGCLVTEHDVLPGDWYLDNGRAPGCIAIESGQADLFLSAYLGIDFQTRGLAVYRLLDAAVTFHRGLPVAGEVLRYEIHLDGFFRQGDTYLFRFRFEGTVGGEPVLTMTDGCAGFFTEAELAGGRGIVKSKKTVSAAIASRSQAPAWERKGSWTHLVPVKRETYTELRLDSLRVGDLAGCFGEPFDKLPLRNPLTLPGDKLRVIHRIVQLDPEGGPFGLGIIRAEQDIHPDDWFLTCHFIDDQVMPGTLMYECCLHTLRFYLLRLGWIADVEQAHFEPKPGVTARLRCRGQVIATTRTASYEITIRELGTEPFPYAIADALMYADGKAIVEITGMSMQLSGVRYADLQQQWQKCRTQHAESSFPSSSLGTRCLGTRCLFTKQQILAFARGNPSEAYGENYRIFDRERRMARLPGPPYSFIDRVISSTAEPWRMVAGGEAITEFDVQPDDWYFAADRQKTMPFSVLLEVALQSCGWLAAYIGSALTSSLDLRFRNLQGTAKILESVATEPAILKTTVRLTRIDRLEGMIIQHYDYSVSNMDRVVIEGNTAFGFFSDAALSRQVGIQGAAPYHPSREELKRAKSFPYPTEAPFPSRQLRMIDHIDLYILYGGPHGLGYIEGSYDVDPDAWFFQAHFYQDPVCPGSLGLEALLQLLKVAAIKKFAGDTKTVFEMPAGGTELRWLYRGQIVPSNAKVTVQAEITALDEKQKEIVADGWLSVDGLMIYQMKGFSLRIRD